MPHENLLLFPRKFLPFFHWPLNYIYFVILCIYIAILVLGLLRYDSQLSVVEVAKISESYLLAFMSSCLFYPTWSQLNKVVEILDNSHFLDVDRFDGANESKALDIVETVSVVKNAFCAAILTIATLFISISLYGNDLIFYISLPDIQYLTKFTAVIQILVVYIIVFSILLMNSFFVCICGTVVSQIRLLNYMVRKFIVETKGSHKLSRNLKMCVVYHNYLLEIIDQVKNIYSELFVLLYMVTVAVICAELLMSSIGLPSMMEYARRFVAIIALSLQLGYYCFFAQFLLDEAQQVADAMYNTDWIEHGSKEVGYFVGMVIMRSQSKSLRFTAGHMTDVDRSLFVKIIQLTFSMFALLKSKK